LLYYRGIVNSAENQGNPVAIAIVGTRYPTAHCKKWTQRIAQTLAQQGFTIVSGMAAGIDGIAHQACLGAGGRTVAVLGTGLDQIYPPNHRSLYEQIQQQGLILSEYPQGTPPDRSHFPARNRIIAGLARATLVLEAPEKSGSLITVRYANEFGRDVYTLPNSPDIEQSRGCLRLLQQGATPILTLDELLEQLGAIPQLDPQLDPPHQLSLLDSPTPALPQFPKEWQPIWQVISHEPLPFDAIIQATGQMAGDVSGILLQMELAGLICQLPGMRYQKMSELG
jgi:DNA processing protein